MGVTTVPAPPLPLREVELHRLWAEQRFPEGALRTAAGAPVRVLYRGRIGAGPGPDFRWARISIGGAEARLGDVELHVNAADFRHHGHPRDLAYRRVILHVVFDDHGERETALPGGGSAPIVALRPWVERRAAEILAHAGASCPAATVEPVAGVPTVAGGPAASGWREPCTTAIGRLGVPPIEALLHAGGEARLRAKATAIAAELRGDAAEHVLFRGICGALGLAVNVEPFRRLAERMPLATLIGECADAPDDAAIALLTARLLDAAGFGSRADPLGSLNWVTAGLRPAAHPARRIEALARLIVRHRQVGLLASLREAWSAGASHLLAALTVPGIGRPRAIEIAVNALLPYLIATGHAETAFTLAARLPAAAAYGRLSLLSGALAAGGRSLVAASALAQQGALALDCDWCRRGGCGRCPLS